MRTADLHAAVHGRPKYLCTAYLHAAVHGRRNTYALQTYMQPCMVGRNTYALRTADIDAAVHGRPK